MERDGAGIGDSRLGLADDTAPDRGVYPHSNLATEYVGCRQPLLLPVARDGV